MRRPGRWLRIGFARLCAKQTMERLIDPIVVDIQTEHAEALRTGRRWRAAWICINGHAAFWRAVGLHMLQSGPRALWNGLAADSWTLGRTIGYCLIAFLGVTLLLIAPPMIGVYSRHQSWLILTVLDLPQVIPLSIPIALPLGITCGMYGTRLGARRIRGVLLLGIVATLLALGAMLTVPVADDAYRVVLARELDRRGISFSLQEGPNAMFLSELTALTKEYDAGGFSATARKFRRAYHLRFALPAATCVLSLLALGICGFVRGRAWRIIAIVLTLGVYWAILAFGEQSATVSPIVSVWAPNLVLTAIAVALLHRGLARYRRGQYA